MSNELLGFVLNEGNGRILLKDRAHTFYLTDPKKLPRYARHLDRPVVGMAPRDEEREDAVSRVCCLWLRTASRAQVESLARHQPRPTVEMGHGSKRTYIWALREPVGVWQA